MLVSSHLKSDKPFHVFHICLCRSHAQVTWNMPHSKKPSRSIMACVSDLLFCLVMWLFTRSWRSFLEKNKIHPTESPSPAYWSYLNMSCPVQLMKNCSLMPLIYPPTHTHLKFLLWPCIPLFYSLCSSKDTILLTRCLHFLSHSYIYNSTSLTETLNTAI